MILKHRARGKLSITAGRGSKTAAEEEGGEKEDDSDEEEEE